MVVVQRAGRGWNTRLVHAEGGGASVDRARRDPVLGNQTSARDQHERRCGQRKPGASPRSVCPGHTAGNGALLAAFSGQKIGPHRRNGRSCVATMPSRPVRRVLDGDEGRTSRRSVQVCRMVRRRSMDVLHCDGRRRVAPMASAIPGRVARTAHVWRQRGARRVYRSRRPVAHHFAGGDAKHRLVPQSRR